MFYATADGRMPELSKGLFSHGYQNILIELHKKQSLK